MVHPKSRILSASRLARFLIVGAAVSVASLFAPSPSFAQKPPEVMKIGTATLNDSQHEWMKNFASKVGQDSGGRIKVEIYPASQLGSTARMIENTQFGAIQGWVGPPEFLSGVDPRFEVLTAPGVFRSMDHFGRTLEDPEFKKEFFQLGSKKGLQVISIFPVGPASIAARKPLQSLSDLRGLKLRVLASPLQMEQVRLLGASAVPMTLGDVLPALQQGTIDGVLSALPVVTALKFQGASPHLLETNQAQVAALTAISKTWFDGLSPDLQAIVLRAGESVGKEISQYAKTYFEQQRRVWVENGGVLKEVPTAEFEEMMKSMAAIGPQVVSKDPASKALYERLLEAARRAE